MLAGEACRRHVTPPTSINTPLTSITCSQQLHHIPLFLILLGCWHQVYNCETLRLVLVGPQVRCSPTCVGRLGCVAVLCV